MIRPLREFMVSMDEMTITRKTTLLFLIMVVGMLFIGGFAHVSINRIKNNFDILYTKRMLPTSRLENLKDIYTVNILDTIHDIEKGSISAKEGKVVIALAQELIRLELQEYKSSLHIEERDWFDKLLLSWGLGDMQLHTSLKPKEEDVLASRIEMKIHTINGILFNMFTYFDLNHPSAAIEIVQNELYPSVYAINIDITGLINLNLEGAKQGFSRTQMVYENTFGWIVVASLGTIFLAALLAIVLLQNIRLLHTKLAKMVDEKTKELQELNYALEQKVLYEVEQSRQKDKIMFRQSRLASMGEMIGNIAHQWRQPLNALVLVIQSFQMKKMAGLELSDEFVEKQAKEGIALASSMSQTIDDFRNFFKPNKDAKIFSAKKMVIYSIKLVKEYYAKTGIEIYISGSDIQVSGYPNEFSQVIMNLFSNAKDALEERDVSEKYIEVLISKEGENAIIGVIDNGGGISEEVQDRMFEPYFTTKHKASGTGIGLYMSKQIIENQMNGTISSTNISYTFQNGKQFSNCAIITMILPLNKSNNQ